MRRKFFKNLLIVQLALLLTVTAGCQHKPSVDESSTDDSMTDESLTETSDLQESSVDSSQLNSEGDILSSNNSGSQTKTTGSQSSNVSSNSASFNSGYSNLNANASFSLNNPSRKPNFTADEIARQKKAGESLLQEIRTAAQDLSKKQYVIPKGNYGFDLSSSKLNGIRNCAVLSNIKRPDDNPFTIVADGATFWFEYTNARAASVSRGLYLSGCENIVIKNLTIDTYTATAIEGTITKIDADNSSIEIKLNAGSLADESKILNMTGAEQRIIPVKANGDAMPSLYNINNTWGPEYLWIDNVTKSGTDQYVLHFKSSQLFKTIYTNEWKNAYGSAGQLEVGDGVSYIYGVVIAVCLDDSKQITIDGLHCYISKGGLWENGGYGNHKWINCDLRPRAGTNQILGTDGFMSQGIRVGSTYDNLTFGITSDDVINIHGFWSKITNATGNTITMDYASVGIKEGDPVEFYSAAGKLVTTLTVAETPASNYNYNGFLTSSVKLSANPPSGYEYMKICFPNSQCNNWKISNCKFLGTYQRILVQSGSGTIENNVIYNMGSILSFDSNIESYEGGFLGNITVKNNLIMNSGIHPGAAVMKLWFVKGWAASISSGAFTITGNVCIGSGSYLIDAANITSVDVNNNVIVDPLRYTAIAKPSLLGQNVCVNAINVKSLSITNNSLFEQTEYTTGNKFTTQGVTATISGNKTYIDASNKIRNTAIQAFENKSLNVSGKIKMVFDTAGSF